MPRKRYSFAITSYNSTPKPPKTHSLDKSPAPAGVPYHLPGFKNHLPVRDNLLANLYRRQPFYVNSKRYHYKLDLPTESISSKKWASDSLRNKSKDPNTHSLRPESTKKLRPEKWYNPLKLVLKNGKALGSTGQEFNKVSLSANTSARNFHDETTDRKFNLNKTAMENFQSLDLDCEKNRFHKWIIDNPITQNKETTIYDQHGLETQREIEKSLERVNDHKTYRNVKPKDVRCEVIKGLLHNSSKRDKLKKLAHDMDEVAGIEDFVKERKLGGSSQKRKNMTDNYFYYHPKGKLECSDAILESNGSWASSRTRQGRGGAVTRNSNPSQKPKSFRQPTQPDSWSKEPKNCEYTNLKDKYKGFLKEMQQSKKSPAGWSSFGNSFEESPKKNEILVQNQSADFDSRAMDFWDRGAGMRTTGDFCRTDHSEERQRTFPGGNPKPHFTIETQDINLTDGPSFLNLNRPSQGVMFEIPKKSKQPKISTNPLNNKIDPKSDFETASGSHNTPRDLTAGTPDLFQIDTLPIL